MMQPDQPARNPVHGMTRDPQAGFTLIETLVALTVLATSAVALIGATQAHVNRIAGLEQRAAAQWVAENALAEARLGLDLTAEPATMLGYDFSLTTGRAATSDAAVERVTVQVSGNSGATLASVSGFVLTTTEDRQAQP